MPRASNNLIDWLRILGSKHLNIELLEEHSSGLPVPCHDKLSSFASLPSPLPAVRTRRSHPHPHPHPLAAARAAPQPSYLHLSAVAT